MLVLNELPAGRKTVIISRETAISGCYPQDSIFIFEQICDHIARDPIGIARLISENGKIITIVSVEPIVGSEPDEAPCVLENAIHLIIRKTILAGYLIKIQRRYLGGKATYKGYKQL
jgi:hypothetical protein